MNQASRACTGVLATGTLLVAPELAVKLWTSLAIGYYTAAQFGGDAAAFGAVCVLAVLTARWRVAGVLSWPLALLVYALALLVEVAEALSYYFQASSFNLRFFANVRWANLRSGFDVFPTLFIGATVLLAVATVFAGVVLARQSRAGSVGGRLFPRAAALVGLVAIGSFVPAAWSRLASVFRSDAALVASARGRQVAAWLDPAPLPPGAVTAARGKNLVIIYMESLERIYTDQRVFPGLTPNLDRWRARGLDFPGFLTFSGATFTIAGLFASQCGSAYYPAPTRAFDSSGDDPNDTSFHPELACLGDVLHKAGYEQVFMDGAPLAFANKGAFFRMHGFDQVLGLDELQRQDGATLPAPGWGLYDSDLLRLATRKFDALAASGRPFNLDVLTVDNHPPAGRPSPGCPAYAANRNDTLQAVHCTDDLVGRFLDAMSRSPAFKDTVVVVMSDHQSMRNDAWPLYPGWYHRRPLLFVLNAGVGWRTARFYHMDIAPTVLHLMGVKTNATFMAGADRSAPDAPGSPLLNDPVDVAVARHALWANAQPLQACRGGVLLASSPNGLRLGGHDIALTERGAPLAGLSTDQELAVRVGERGLTTIVADPAELEKRLAKRGRAGALVVRPLADPDPGHRLAIGWLGARGAKARLADVPTLAGLEVTSPDCAALIRQADAAPPDSDLDLRAAFRVTTAPLYPPLPAVVDFSQPGVAAWQRGVGWLPAAPGGSWTLGDFATLGFSLPPGQCHAARLEVTAHPFLTKSRPRLDARVLVNERPAATWAFAADAGGMQTFTLPVTGVGVDCHVDLRFDFSRPGAAPPPYPPDEDPRALQLEVAKLRLLPADASSP